MAILKLGPILSEIRGTTGGTTFRRHKSRTIATAQPSGRRSRSSMQTTTCSGLARASNYWRATLTAAQRARWDRYASAIQLASRKTLTHRITGRSAFIAENTLRSLGGITWLTSAPSVPAIAKTPTWTIAVSSHTSFSFNCTSDPILSGEWIFCSFSKPFSAAAANPRTWSLGYIIYPGPFSSIGFLALPRTLNAGQTFICRTRRISNTARFSNAAVWRLVSL